MGGVYNAPFCVYGGPFDNREDITLHALPGHVLATSPVALPRYLVYFVYKDDA